MSDILLKIAITWEEYKDLHPRTRKKPNDPLFSKGKRAPAKKVIPQPGQLAETPKVAPKKKAPAKVEPKAQKTLDEMTDDELIDSFKPELKKSSFQRKMELKDFLYEAHMMNHDDLVWHLMNSKFVEDDGHKEMRAAFGKVVDVAGYYGLALLNPNVSKKFKGSAASWILDKGGVSFVASRKLKKFIKVAAAKGYFNQKDIEHELEGDKERELRDKICADYTEKEIRKLVKSNKNVEEHWDSICENPNVPGDVLVDMLENSNEALIGLKWFKKGMTHTSGAMGGAHKKMERKTDMSHALKVLSSPNFPLDKLYEHFGPVMDNLVKKNNYKAHHWAAIICNNSQINEPKYKKIRNAAVKILGMPLVEVKDEEETDEEEANSRWGGSKKTYGGYRGVRPPTKVSLSEKEFLEMFENEKRAEYPHMTEYYEHPSCPEKILRNRLARKNPKDEKYFFEKKAAFKNMMDRKLFKDEELVKAVNTNLNLHGDPALLKRMAEHAIIYGKSTNKIPRTITKCTPDEKKQIEDQMKKTHYHDQFDYEVVDAYNIDKEPHKDFDATAAKIGGVLTDSIYHGTSFSNAGGILSDGVRMDTEARTGSMFGRGFYLASSSSKAAQYAGDNFSQNEGEGIVFQLHAAMGKNKEMKFGRPADDNMEYRALTPEEVKMAQEYKKKQGKELKDKWHATHDSVTAKAGLALEYDEYVVKDPSQIKIKKIVVVKKTPKPGAEK